MNVEYTIKFKGKFKPDVEAYIEGMIQETSKEYVENIFKDDTIEKCRNDFDCEKDYVSYADYDIDVEVKLIEGEQNK